MNAADDLARRAPGPRDDAPAGYAPGDLWAGAGGGLWRCKDSAEGQAVWEDYRLAGLAAGDAVAGGPPAAAYGTRRLVAGYDGPLLRVVHPQTRAKTDIYAAGEDDIDRAALAQAMAGADSLSVCVLYDQSGHGHHATQKWPGHQPRVRPDLTLGNAVKLIFDSAGKPKRQFFELPDTLRWPVGMPSSQVALAGFRSWYRSQTGITTMFGADGKPTRPWGSRGNQFGVVIADTADVTLTWPGSPRVPLTPFVSGYVSTAGATEVWLDNMFEHKTTGYCPAVKGGTIGQIGASSYGSLQLAALMIYDWALLPAAAKAASAALYRQFGVAPQLRDAIMCCGDSNTFGTGSTLNETWPQLMCARLARPAHVSNSGIFGSRVTDWVPGPLNEAQLRKWFLVPAARNILVFFAGTNDLAGNINAEAIYKAMTKLVARCHGMGIKIVLVTTLTRKAFPAGGTPPGEWEAQRLALNAMITGNAAGADGIADLAGDEILGDYGNNNLGYFIDGVHPRSYPTYERIAGIVAAVVNGID